ncbi:ribonuclease H [Fulvimarina sp. 2208YS6-2-32]|uniref:ribonuclease H n=1 Tax=Fulvimarina uroteuthidis TaxID=3098149 RepID=A0ABU5HY33_9HYPH|nr:ribonuclease H [Fulvimarina sp. 2208YS6-2-32]MDY8108046.1 ribonuclease H [Fulvimarina sp. 2208YS6-2-32]
MHNTNTSLHIYTDGSCLNNPGRSAFSAIIEEVTEDGDLVKRWTATGREKDSTNQRAELLAAIEGLRAVPSDFDGKIVVVTDSRYLSDGMEKWMPGWKAKGLDKRPNADLWRILNKLSDNKNIRFKWVKGHSGHSSNETAHALAYLTLQTEIA